MHRHLTSSVAMLGASRTASFIRRPGHENPVIGKLR
jgi:hypothetical protein